MIPSALVALLVASPPCVSAYGSTLSRAQAEVRVSAVRALLVREHDAHALWQTTWVATLAGAAAGQASWANADVGQGGRAALLVGTLKATMGVLAVVSMPEPNLPDPWRGDVCVQLAAAEAALVDLAAAQAAGTALWRHAGSLLVNLAATLFVGLAYDDWVSAASSGVLGAVFGQLMLRTRPDGAVGEERPVVSGSVGPGTVGLVVCF